ncbi:hypothetical protein GFL72_02180 [Rhizobium leguminosarum bv. viciae]|nr:hypothetical protein [Rhizobium leguminosarum bv. viciae]
MNKERPVARPRKAADSLSPTWRTPTKATEKQQALRGETVYSSGARRLGGNDMAEEWPLYILQCMVLIGLAGIFVIK